MLPFSNRLHETDYFSEDAKSYDHVECTLTEIPVEVPYATDGVTVPGFINLHRCLGGCKFSPPSYFHCATQNTANVFVKTWQASLITGDVYNKVERLVNHTKCGCQCIVQKYDCNPETHFYDPDQCACKCKNLAHTCDPKLKVRSTIILS